MTTTKNNEHKKLNFSSEREQSQACLNSAEHEKNQGRKVLNVPNLRFKEFQGEWEKCKLGNIANITGGYAFKSDTLNSIGGKYQVVKMGNLYQNQLDLHRSPSYTDTLTRKAENVILRKDDIAITLTGTNNKKDFGYTYIFNDEKNLLLNQRCGLVRAKGNPYFLSCLLKTHTFLNQFFESATGGTGNQANVSTKAMEMFSVNTPSLKEQEKIGQLMALLDERIATQNKIIDKLQSLIKGIAQKIVCNNMPNVRLTECLECNSSTLQESEVCEQGTYPVYGANGIVGYLDNYNTEGEAVYIIKDGSGVGTVSYVTGKCSATGTLNTLQTKDGYSLQYFYYLLKVFNFEPYKTGMAIPHIYFKDYGKAKVFCPSYTEQLQYARLLSAIESNLSIEMNILTNLSLQKQYLLRQMFI